MHSAKTVAFLIFFKEPFGILADDETGFDLRVVDPLLKVPVLFEHIALALLLPLLLVCRRTAIPETLRPEALILPRLMAVSAGLFVLSSLLLFHLYTPNRHVRSSLPILLCVAAGLALGVLSEAIVRDGSGARQSVASLGIPMIVGLLVATYPVGSSAAFRRDRNPAMTTFLRGQPKDVLVAGPFSQSDVIPALAGRRVLTSREFALPFHLGYYDELQRRARALILAYYARSPAVVLDFATLHRVDVFIVTALRSARTATREPGAARQAAGSPLRRWRNASSAETATHY